MSRKGLLIAGLAMLSLIALGGCSLLLRDDAVTPAGSGWYIQLRIQVPAAASKAITVTEYDVTALQILVCGPDGKELQTINWQATEDEVTEEPQTYLVPVKQLGEHQIEVIHFGEYEGEPVQATESAKFNIQAMKITVIDIVPGCIGLIRVNGEQVQPGIDLSGYWDMTIYLEEQQPIGPMPLCLKQTGSQLDAQFHFGGFCPGSFDGENVTFEGDPGGGMVVTFAGKVEGEQINGDATAGSLTATFSMARSTLPFGHWDIDGSYQGLPIALNTEYAFATRDDDPVPVNFIVTYYDTVLSAYLWFNVVGVELEEKRTYYFPGEAWGSLHWSYHIEEFERDIELEGRTGTLYIDTCTTEGIIGSYDIDLGEDGSISGSFDVSFVAN
jgi:hypothetical protein